MTDVRTRASRLAGQASAGRDRLPWALAALTIGLQIGYPLTTGAARNPLTVATVVTFFLASTSHAVLHRGRSWAGRYAAVTTGTGLLAEAVGTRTGVPFGHYAYAHTLGPMLLGVPVVIPMAWSMTAYPCLLAGQRLVASRTGAAVVGGWALASWDLFLDPQMVAAGHWRWTGVRHALPGAPGIPVSNYLGWLAVAVLMLAVLQALPRRCTDDRQPAAMLLWTYASSVLGAAVFFGRPVTALVGAVGMGVIVLPYARSLNR